MDRVLYLKGHYWTDEKQRRKGFNKKKTKMEDSSERKFSINYNELLLLLFITIVQVN